MSKNKSSLLLCDYISNFVQTVNMQVNETVVSTIGDACLYQTIIKGYFLLRIVNS
jgi:hypothetical protein